MIGICDELKNLLWDLFSTLHDCICFIWEFGWQALRAAWESLRVAFSPPTPRLTYLIIPIPGPSHTSSAASGSNDYRGESTTNKANNTFRNRVRSVDICAICLNEVYESAENGDQPRDLPCAHRFHTKCIKLWQSAQRQSMQKLFCPICREEVNE